VVSFEKSKLYLRRTLFKKYISTYTSQGFEKLWSLSIFKNSKNQVLNNCIIEEKIGQSCLVNHSVYSVFRYNATCSPLSTILNVSPK